MSWKRVGKDMGKVKIYYDMRYLLMLLISFPSSLFSLRKVIMKVS